MQNQLEKIRELIKILPNKDYKICEKYLEERKFQSILEIVRSDMYKDMPDENITKMFELESELGTYVAGLEVSDNSDDDYNDDYY